MLHRCDIRNIRIVRRGFLTFDPVRTLIVGDNGTGKTSVLEAIYAAVHGYSFRTRQLQELVTHGAPEGWVELALTPGMVRTTFRVSDGRKECELDGVPVRQRDVAFRIPIFAFHHRQLGVVRGSPVEAYRFFNQVLARLFPAYASDLLATKRALRQKRQLLRNDVENDMIYSWNRVLEQYRTRLMEKRFWLSEQLNIELPQGVQIQYVPNHPDHPLDRFLEVEKRSREVQVGPHLDRYRFLYRGHDVRGFGSSGQQRAVFFQVMAAVGHIYLAEREIRPVLLLDDFDSEFDAENLDRNMNLISDRFQVVVSTTDAGRFGQLPFKRIRLARGGVIEE